MAVGTFTTDFNVAIPTLVLSGTVTNVDHGIFVSPVLNVTFSSVLSGTVVNVNHGAISVPAFDVTFTTVLTGTVQ